MQPTKFEMAINLKAAGALGTVFNFYDRRSR
jgi:hypothetical protein